MYGETRDVVECFSLLLECSCHFLSVLHQNRAQTRHLYLFYDKETVKLSRHEDLLSNFQLRVLYSQKARFFNQSESALYLNFVKIHE